MHRRQFLATSGLTALAAGLPGASLSAAAGRERADYTIRTGTALVEVGPQRFLSMTAYNGQFPGPLLRFKEGRPVVIDIHNDTDTPEQLHWHGQLVPASVDGAAEHSIPALWISTSPPISPVRCFSTATSSCTWTTASWRCSRRPESARV